MVTSIVCFIKQQNEHQTSMVTFKVIILLTYYLPPLFLFIEFIVLTHSLVEEYFFILQTVLEGSPGDFFLMHGSFVGDFGLYLLFNLIQNLLLILVLILEDQEVLLLVLKQSSEHVSLPLESLSL